MGGEAAGYGSSVGKESTSPEGTSIIGKDRAFHRRVKCRTPAVDSWGRQKVEEGGEGTTGRY